MKTLEGTKLKGIHVKANARDLQLHWKRAKSPLNGAKETN